MDTRIARSVLLATSLLTLSLGANVSHTAPASSSQPDNNSLPNDGPGHTYSPGSAPPASYSSSLWQLLASHH
jgi:hypothetical protein